MSDETMTPAACWAMFRNTPEFCNAPVLAAAFLYAAERGWITDDFIGGLPGDDPEAADKLRARSAFRHLVRAPEMPSISDIMSVLEAVPDKWLEYTAAHQLLTGLELSIGNGEALSEKDRERFGRIVRRTEEE